MSNVSPSSAQDGILQQVRDAIEEHDLIPPDGRVVVGVSGGPDSLCLLHALRQLRETHELRLHVAHLNHGTRGEASDADAEFVRTTAIQWDMPVTTVRRDVPRLAEEHDLAFEEAARRVRYAFLGDVATKIGATTIAVGHQADDQAETVLMHIIRGAGLAGLRGMLPRTRLTDYQLLSSPSAQEEKSWTEGRRNRGARTPRSALCLIRPLLRVPRADIERYCAKHNLKPRFDRSNLDTTYFRNRLRHELLPELETYNPQIRERLRHMAAIAAADYEVLEDVQERAWERVVREENHDSITFDKEEWQALPVSLQRGTLRRASRELRQNLRDVTFAHVENAREIALDGETGKASTLPKGLVLTVSYNTLRVSEADAPMPFPDEPLLWSDVPLPVSAPGLTPLPDTDWVLRAEHLNKWTMRDIKTPDHPWTGFFDADAVDEPVILRSRRRGDLFQPLGMDGHRVKISDLMINLKIPEAWRDQIPLLVSAGRILWLCGRRVAESGKVKPDTRQVVKFSFELAE